MLVAEDLEHAESRASCQDHGMDLAMVTSAQIQTMITTTITENSAGTYEYAVCANNTDGQNTSTTVGNKVYNGFRIHCVLISQ